MGAWKHVSIALATAALVVVPVSSASAVTNVTATVETQPVPSTGDAADDPAIWVNRANPAQSAVIGNDKGGGLEVYDMAGNRLQRISEGFFGNVDVRHDFPTGTGQVELVGTYRAGLRFYSINPNTRQLTNVTDSATGSINSGIGGEGFCLYHSPVDDRFHAFVVNRQGVVAQFRLSDSDGDGLIEATRVRSWEMGSEAESCVTDDDLGDFYISQEEVGIWKYGAEPSDGTGTGARTLVESTVANGGRIRPDAEGLTIVYQPGGQGYLIASSQAGSNTANSYLVYEREGSNAFVDEIKVVSGTATDGCGRTDGIDAMAANLGPSFPNGMFVCQDNDNTTPGTSGNQNFKFVPLERVVDLGPASNQPPTAAFTPTCDGMTCHVDAHASSDPDGTIASYAWTFGDGDNGTGIEDDHTYDDPGTYQIRLTVTDNDGESASRSESVTVPDTSTAISFGAVNGYVGNALAPEVRVPNTVAAGDTLLLFASLNKAAPTVQSPGAGWSQLSNFTSSTQRVLVYQKVAQAGDAGSTVVLRFSARSKVTLQLAAYTGTATTTPVSASANRADPNKSTSHVSPQVSVTTPGSWLVTYWADKSATTTAWNGPAGSTHRQSLLGSGTGYISSLLVDSGAPLATGSAGSLTATTNAASRGGSVSIVLRPGG